MAHAFQSPRVAYWCCWHAFFFVLAIAAYSAAQNFESTLESSARETVRQQRSKALDPSSKAVNILNPFMGSRTSQKQSLMSRFFDLNEQYRSMYFKKEQEILRIQLVRVLKQLVNLYPFDTRYSQHLFYAHPNSKLHDREYAWLINRTYRLLKWNTKQYRHVARYCVAEYAQLEPLSAHACAKVVSDVASNNDAQQLSRILKQDHIELEQRYQETGLNFEFKRQ